MIGYYVHHHGSGHLTRATGIAAACSMPVTGLSSLPRPENWAGAWVELPRDDSPGGEDPTAGGTLHWAPLRHNGYRERMEAIAGWIARERPSVFVTDVSVEVTMLARLLGVPVVVLAMRGDRDDRAHRAAYDAAELLLAPWPGLLPEPTTPAVRAKTFHTGAFSRFDDLGATAGPATPAAPAPREQGERVVSVLWGRGGGEWTDTDRLDAQAATPGYRWETAGRDRPVWESLTHADVVVTHAGQNAVAEVAAARRPAVVVALSRPHGEQQATAAALEGTGLAATTAGSPSPSAWPDLLKRARELNPGGGGWTSWSDGRGARRAACALEAVASGQRIAGGTAVVTLVHGRHDHLRGLVAGLRAGTTLPERLVVVALGDDQVSEVTEVVADEPWAEVVSLSEGVGPGGLRLAAARNLGAATAARLGCERLIFLDVDCIPGAALVREYHEALLLRRTDATGPHVLAGPVTYLPPPEEMPHNGIRYEIARLPELRSPHPARPAPETGEQIEADDLLLFWSLSFALRAEDFDRIGGFWEEYDGYGGEDTDFAMALGAAGGRLTWLGGADAYHQHHPTSNPPVQHLHDIVRNANVFAGRWGFHPMQGWLEEFAERGLTRFDEVNCHWVVSGQEAG